MHALLLHVARCSIVPAHGKDRFRSVDATVNSSEVSRVLKDLVRRNLLSVQALTSIATSCT
jgi:hypothetical protein